FARIELGAFSRDALHIVRGQQPAEVPFNKLDAFAPARFELFGRSIGQGPLEIVQNRQQPLDVRDSSLACRNSSLLVDASAIVDEVGLGTLRQAQIFVGLL